MQSLDKRSKYLRSLIVEMIEVKKGGHFGPALSLVEILRVLYDDVLKINPKDPNNPKRDRLILSKGHGCLALYSILFDKGFFNKKILSTFCSFHSPLGGHPEKGKLPGIEASTGSLGHGLPIGVGIALAAKLRKQKFQTFVIVGDGEINEGSNWEAFMTASKYKLDNLTIIVDSNKFQSYGETEKVLKIRPLKKKLESFGLNVYEVDGHNVQDLRKVLKLVKKKNIPNAIICNTIKGRGFAFAEAKAEWHHKSNLTEDNIKKMYESLK